ncbi:MAG: hypothetical protein U0175_16900 [Caldilineaceae bacterium]
MFYSDTKMAQIEYERRLREAAEARLVQQLLAQQAPKQKRFWERLGDLLTLAGMGLKGWDGSHYPTGR